MTFLAELERKPLPLETPGADKLWDALPASQEVAPRHVGIMMDGNGRWASRRGLPRLAGHRAGTRNVLRVLDACAAHGLRTVTLYVFSTENWGRPPEEVAGFFELLAEVIDREIEAFHARGVQLRHSGSLEGVPASLAQRVRAALALTRNNRDYVLNIAFNYGGRSEILRAAQALARAHLPPELLDERTFARELQTAGLPDIDLVIRTGGEERLSNFFPWQAAHALFYLTAVLWPDFDESELTRAVSFYRSASAVAHPRSNSLD